MTRSDTYPIHRPLRPLALGRGAPAEITVRPTAEERTEIARRLRIPAVESLQFRARMVPVGGEDWALEGQLDARVVQECVITLEPVQTRIREEVVRRYRADLEDRAEPGETEMPAEVDEEPLPERIDLFDLVCEALSLALPDYPRRPGARFAGAEAAPPDNGATGDEADDPARAEALAALRALRRRMEGGGDG